MCVIHAPNVRTNGAMNKRQPPKPCALTFIKFSLPRALFEPPSARYGVRLGMKAKVRGTPCACCPALCRCDDRDGLYGLRSSIRGGWLWCCRASHRDIALGWSCRIPLVPILVRVRDVHANRFRAALLDEGKELGELDLG